MLVPIVEWDVGRAEREISEGQTMLAEVDVFWIELQVVDEEDPVKLNIIKDVARRVARLQQMQHLPPELIHIRGLHGHVLIVHVLIQLHTHVPVDAIAVQMLPVFALAHPLIISQLFYRVPGVGVLGKRPSLIVEYAGGDCLEFALFLKEAHVCAALEAASALGLDFEVFLHLELDVDALG